MRNPPRTSARDSHARRPQADRPQGSGTDALQSGRRGGGHAAADRVSASAARILELLEETVLERRSAGFADVEDVEGRSWVVKTAEMHVEPRGKRRGAPVRLQSCRDVATSPAHNCHDAAGPGNLERMS